MKLGALYSGGKDSTYAMMMAKEKGHEFTCLINIISENQDSYMFHSLNKKMPQMQSEAMNLPLLTEHTKGEKEDELEDLERAIRKAKEKYDIEGVTAGAIASKYQKERVEKICDKLDLEVIAPFWGADPEETMKKIIDSGIEFIIVRVAADGMDQSWLGRKIDGDALKDLKKIQEKNRIHIMFEGGEADTLVLGCPLFNKRIEVKESEKHWDGVSGWFEIKEAEVVGK